MNWPSVSLCLTTYNRREQVLKAVSSCLKQDYHGEIEVVVVDDGSTDGTVLPEGVKLIRHDENMGIAVSKNDALRGGSGELRAILDSDDTFEPAFVRRCVEELTKYPEIGLVFVDNFRVDSRNPRRRVVDRAIDWSLEAWLSTCNLRGDTWLARWDVLKRTQLHDERFKLEVDGDLFYQLAELTEFKRIPEPLQTVTEHTGRFSRDYKQAAYWHAAGLGKYGHSIDYAVARAKRHGAYGKEWAQSIVDGYTYGCSLRKKAAVA